MMPGRTLGEAFVNIRADTSKTGADVDKAGREQGRKYGKSFGDQVLGSLKGLNVGLKDLGFDEIDIKANPREALAAIEATELKLKELSGDAATVEVKVKTERARSELSRFKKQLGDIAGDVGTDAGPKVAQAVSGSLLKTLGPALAGAGVALAPFLGAAISGAIIGGAGAGGVIGGVLLASRDARVETAGKALGKRFLSSLETDASPFIDPLLKGIDTLDAALGREEGHIRSIFANASRYVEPLIGGLVGFLDPVIGGFDDLVAHAGPVIAAIRIGLSDVGRAVGDVFHSLADDGQSAAAAIYASFQIVANGIRVVGLLLNAFTETFGWIISVEEKLGVISDDGKKALAAIRAAGDAAAGSGQNLGSVFQGLAPTLKQVDAAADPLAKSMQDVAAAGRAVQDANAGLFASNTSVAEALKTANEQIGKHHKGLSADTAAGRTNRTALSNVATALKANYDAYVAINGVTPGTQRKADDLRTKFYNLARQTGVSAAKARELTNSILGIPAGKTVNIHANTHDAAGRIAALKAQIRSIPSYKQIDVAIRVTGTSASRSAVAAALGKQSLPGRASGGPVARGVAYLVGERRPELFVPDTDGTILPAFTTGRTEPIAAAPSMDAVVARLDALIAAVQRVAPGVGQHLSRAVKGVDSMIGYQTDLAGRTAW